MPCICQRLQCAPCWRCEAALAFLATDAGQELQRAWQAADRRWRSYQRAQAALVDLSCRAFALDADMVPWQMEPDATRCWRVLQVLGLTRARISTVWSKVRDAYDRAQAGEGL